MLRKVVVEVIGTFFLVLTIGLVVIEPGAGAFAPLAIGCVLVALVYAGAHVSGAHYNPAVTLGVYLRGRARAAEIGPYWAAQSVGAVLAFAAVRGLRPGAAVQPIAPEVGPALLAELLFTFALVYVILNVATAAGNEGNSHYGLAIGFTVTAGAYAVGGVSGAAFNPAVAVGITLLGISPLGNLWIYLAANFAGAAAAALLFNALHLGADKPTSATPAEQERLRPQAEPAP